MRKCFYLLFGRTGNKAAFSGSDSRRIAYRPRFASADASDMLTASMLKMISHIAASEILAVAACPPSFIGIVSAA